MSTSSATDTYVNGYYYCRVGHKKAENIETLFQLYDMLEEDCQNTIKGGRTVPSKEAATATQLLDELRNRFVRLVRLLML